MLESTILIVDDNPDILYNLNLTLKLNGYNVITTENGLKAIDALKGCKEIPDLIISDIAMPEMDGYEFFNKVSKNTDWYHIPFIFLTAKTTPDDVRVGKLLGVDDYITKPFKEDDLIAIVTGKIAKYKRMKAISSKISVSELLKKPVNACISYENPIIIVVEWDEIQGPLIKKRFPVEKTDFSLEEIAVQLFQASASIYGHKDYSDPADLLFHVQNLSLEAYLYFDMIEDDSVRGSQRQFMIATLSPSMSFFHSLKLKKLYKKFASKIRSNSEWDIKKYWDLTSEILTEI